ncbi:hypothetical protein DFR74_10450 [Nocardia puris]|uniref:Bifunctional DNA primase/polymerase-like protein n=1 Tax=Nocardia puris TaxID=208602 RepID=A0A366DQ54_9NOCA|nr:hypothetical protein DFR74_10450 [Nocardia puris]
MLTPAPPPEIWSRRTTYEEVFGLRAGVDSRRWVITVPAGLRSGLGVVRMPADAGRDVRTWLHQNGVRPPIVANLVADTVAGQPERREWLFLAAASTADAALHSAFAALPTFATRQVRLFLADNVLLPTPRDPRQVWIDPPRGRSMPLLAALAEHIRDALKAVDHASASLASRAVR